jgi:hypothetical protein
MAPIVPAGAGRGSKTIALGLPPSAARSLKIGEVPRCWRGEDDRQSERRRDGPTKPSVRRVSAAVLGCALEREPATWNAPSSCGWRSAPGAFTAGQVYLHTTPEGSNQAGLLPPSVRFTIESTTRGRGDRTSAGRFSFPAQWRLPRGGTLYAIARCPHRAPWTVSRY